MLLEAGAEAGGRAVITSVCTALALARALVQWTHDTAAACVTGTPAQGCTRAVTRPEQQGLWGIALQEERGEKQHFSSSLSGVMMHGHEGQPLGTSFLGDFFPAPSAQHYRAKKSSVGWSDVVDLSVGPCNQEWQVLIPARIATQSATAGKLLLSSINAPLLIYPAHNLCASVSPSGRQDSFYLLPSPKRVFTGLVSGSLLQPDFGKPCQRS